jgi:hypothetical protein
VQVWIKLLEFAKCVNCDGRATQGRGNKWIDTYEGPT